MYLKLLIIAGSVLISASAFAQSDPKTHGSSANSPGHQMQNSGTSTGPGASEYAPGQKMKDSSTSTGPGASEYAPSRQTTGSSARDPSKTDPSKTDGR